MRQEFELPIIFADTAFCIHVDKYTSALSIDFVISIKDPALFEITGVRFCIFHYEPDDQDFEYYGVSYLNKKSDLLLPNVVFEIAITAAIRSHERPNMKPTYYSSIT